MELPTERKRVTLSSGQGKKRREKKRQAKTEKVVSSEKVIKNIN